ncbi:hypothetical protein [Lunatibacter salilacus]|uniref:hypothetical protein n=1 Tax=Lunatibacter salilacus TaxID=2483804 RepID=UPI00131D71EB|nr:hypothetical protein [Lunatibacter salilacus]
MVTQSKGRESSIPNMVFGFICHLIHYLELVNFPCELMQLDVFEEGEEFFFDFWWRKPWTINLWRRQVALHREAGYGRES